MSKFAEHPFDRATFKEGDRIQLYYRNGQWLWHEKPVEILSHLRCEDCGEWREPWAPNCICYEFE